MYDCCNFKNELLNSWQFLRKLGHMDHTLSFLAFINILAIRGREKINFILRSSSLIILLLLPGPVLYSGNTTVNVKDKAYYLLMKTNIKLLIFYNCDIYITREIVRWANVMFKKQKATGVTHLIQTRGR